MPPDPAEDCFGPPDEPCEVECIHCGCVYDSGLIRWVAYATGDGYQDGQWCCPVPGCDGAGFGFDIFPTDPDHPANAGWSADGDDEIPFDDDEEEEFDDFPDAPAAGETRGESAGEAYPPPDAADVPFDPPVPWSSEADDADDDYDDGADHAAEPREPKRFTHEDYQRAVTEGVYDRQDSELRDRMLNAHRDHPPPRLGDQDIPF